MRRTKEEAAKTRAQIVEAALACFDRHGIASSTLEQIAACAKVSKGAIYHHFRGKREILREIREQVSLPLLDEADTQLLHGGARPALERIEHFIEGLIDGLETDARLRRALSVMQFKCEYVGVLEQDLLGAARAHRRLVHALEAAYEEARRNGQLAKHLSPPVAAAETSMFLNGLVRLWLLQGRNTRFRKQVRAALRAHMEARQAASAR